MPFICSVCAKPCRKGQKSIQCSKCNEWVHHNNRLNCSNTTNYEFELHMNDDNIFFECDTCSAVLTVKTFAHLPQLDSPLYEEPLEVPVNIFTSTKVNHKEFLEKCSKMDNFFNINNQVDEDVLPATNSKYYDVDELNSLEIDLPSSLK